MKNQKELIEIITKFSNSGWQVIEAPSKAWLENINSEEIKRGLIDGIKQADNECGSCGCEFDPLYKKALALLQN